MEQNGAPVIVYYHVGGNGLRKGLLLLCTGGGGCVGRRIDGGRVGGVLLYASDKKKWRKRKKREKEYERDMTESLRLLRVSRAPAGDLIVAIRKRSVKSVRHTNRTKSNTVIGQS